MVVYPSAPKRNPAVGEGEMRTCSVEEGVRETLSRTAGRALFVTDGTALAAFSSVSSPRATFLVYDGDALPLFCLADGVGCILVAGNAETVRAARYFSEACSVPCAIFPSEAALDGVFAHMGCVFLDKEPQRAPLRRGTVYLDPALLSASAAEGYARLLLGRLALFEERALAGIFRRERCPRYEEGYAVLAETGEDLSSIVRANAALRLAEEEGLASGEGIVLSRGLAGALPSWRAYRALLGLYLAFFRFGKPQTYIVPDYAARAKAAGVNYGELVLPTPAEYASRALSLERVRAEAVRELLSLERRLERDLRVLRTLHGAVFPETCAREAWKTLPERCPRSLSAAIRDFGLMEQL